MPGILGDRLQVQPAQRELHREVARLSADDDHDVGIALPQTAVIRAALDVFEKAEAPGHVEHLPFAEACLSSHPPIRAPGERALRRLQQAEITSIPRIIPDSQAVSIG